MSGYSRIPVKAKCEDAISGVEFEIDTEGLDCIVKAINTDMWIYIKQGAPSSESYFLKADETFEFCGKLYYKVSELGKVYTFMYNRL